MHLWGYVFIGLFYIAGMSLGEFRLQVLQFPIVIEANWEMSSPMSVVLDHVPDLCIWYTHFYGQCLTNSLSFIPLWEWTWCHCLSYVRQDWNLRTIVNLRENMHLTTKLRWSWNAGAHLEAWYDVISILGVGSSLWGESTKCTKNFFKKL